MLTEFEIAILRIVASHETGMNWYGIAIRLSNINLPERPNMMDVLRKLVASNLLSVDPEKNVWHITKAGLETILKAEDESK